MTWIITKTTICSDCTEKRAKEVVRLLREQGFDIEYGDKTNIPTGDTAFSDAFNKAVDKTYGLR